MPGASARQAMLVGQYTSGGVTHGFKLSGNQYVTIDELKIRDVDAYHAFYDFTEAQVMFWQLYVDQHGVLRAVDWQSNVRVRWYPHWRSWQ